MAGKNELILTYIFDIDISICIFLENVTNIYDLLLSVSIWKHVLPST